MLSDKMGKFGTRAAHGSRKEIAEDEGLKDKMMDKQIHTFS